MTLASIIRNGKGKAGHWRVERDAENVTRKLFHYSTLMAEWHLDIDKGRWTITFMSHGHGSVSDQGGMNTLFWILSAPYYYSRKGGATIIDRENGDQFVA